MAWLQDINTLFSDAYATMVTKRAAYAFTPLQPTTNPGTGLAPTNFQIGPEYLAQEQSPPRIVIVPIETPEFSQVQLGRTPADPPASKPVYTGVEYFEAHLWGDSDPLALDTTYSFNSTLELRREFLGAMYSALMGGRAPSSGLTPLNGKWLIDEKSVGMINTCGRAYVLTFAIAMPVLRDPWIATVPQQIIVTPYLTDPVTGANPTSTTPLALPLT